MKIIEMIKRRIDRFWNPPLEDSIRRFSSNGEWAFEELDKWERRFNKIFRFWRKDEEE